MIRALLTGAIALCAIACNKSDAPEPDPKKGPGVTKPAPVQPALTKAAEALDYLPAETLAVAATADPGGLAARLGRAEVIEAVPALAAKASAELRRELGHDLLDPAEWTKIGVDARAPTGVFFLGQPEAVGFFFTVSDAKAFIAWYTAREKRTTTETIGDAQVVLNQGYGPTLVIRGRVAFAFMARGKAWARAWAARLATTSKAESLGADADFTAAIETLDFGADAAGYANVPKLIDMVFAMITRQPDNTRLDAFVEQARKRGDMKLADELSQRRADPGGRRMGKQMAMGAVKGMLFGGLAPLVVGAQVESVGVRIKARMKLGEAAIFRRVLDTPSAGSPLATLAGPEFLFMFGGKVKVDGAVGLIRSVALAVGEADDLEREKQRVFQTFGVDVEKEIIGTLSGDVGFAMLHQDPTAKGDRQLGVTGFAGVKDEKTLRAAADKITGHPMLSGAVKKTEGGFVAEDGWWPVHVRFGPRLLVTSDPGAVERLPGDATPAGLPPALTALLTDPRASAFGAVEIERASLMFMIGRSSWEPPMPQVPDASAEAKLKLEQLVAAQKALTEARDAREKAQNASVRRMIAPLGHLAAVVRIDARGLEIEGGQLIRGKSVPEVVATLVREAAQQDDADRAWWKKSDELRKRVSDLRRELRELDRPAAVPAPR